MGYVGDRLLARRVLSRRSRFANRDRRRILEGMIRRRASATYIGDGVVLATVLGRYKMYLPASDMSVAAHLIADGLWEIWIVETMVELLDRGMVTVDAGANTGFFSLVMADLCAGGHVHAFEPNPLLTRLARRSLTINGFLSRATLHEAALGATDGGQLNLVVPDDEIGGGHLVTDAMLGDAKSIPVPVRRLDAVAGACEAEFVKIDAEGSEPEIWAGMAGMIAGTRLRTVLLEFAPVLYPDPESFLAVVRGDGFAIARVDHVNGIVAATPDDLLAERNGEHMLLLRR